MSLIDARIRELNARVSELLQFNNEFEERARVAERAVKALTTPRPLSEYHEDMGPVLWWCWEPPKPFEQISERVVSSAHNGRWLGEAPYVGTPNDLGQGAIVQVRTSSDQKEDQLPSMRVDVGGWPGYYTHWTPLPKVVAP